MKKKRNLYLITLSFFLLGLININLAWFGLLCFTLPFYLLFRDNSKTWCKKYCPRADLFCFAFDNKKNKKRELHKWFKGRKLKKVVLGYFALNLFVIIMSTSMVALFDEPAVEKVRFLIAFEIPWNLPQLIVLSNIPQWVIHFSYRIYSMMLTSTVIGLWLGYLYKSRTWCLICPVNTLSDIKLSKTI